MAAQSVVISGIPPRRKSLTSSIPQDSILFSIFINDLDDDVGCALRSVLVLDRKLQVVVDRPKDCAAILRDLERLEK